MEHVKYSKLAGDHWSKEDPTASICTVVNRRKATFAIVLLVSYIFGILTVAGVIHFTKMVRKGDLDWLEPAGDLKVQFRYNETYPGPPTTESEQMWLDLLPEGLGAVQHDALGDGIVTLSVFHQLHCLMALRHGLYNTWNETRHSHMSLHHRNHCLEYLRQSIMCNGDTNREQRIVQEKGTAHTPGWDTKRCRNYDALKGWAQEYRAFNGKIPSEKGEVTDDESLKGRMIVY